MSRIPRCIHLGVRPDERLSRSSAYECKAPLPELPDLPLSVTDAIVFNWPPRRSFVSPEDCKAKCPLFHEHTPPGANMQAEHYRAALMALAKEKGVNLP